jgi:hypothetical protein
MFSFSLSLVLAAGIGFCVAGCLFKFKLLLFIKGILRISEDVFSNDFQLKIN